MRTNRVSSRAFRPLIWFPLLSLFIYLGVVIGQDDPPPRYMFVFGDSLTDRQFKLDGSQPSLSNPFGNPATDFVHGIDYSPNWLERLILNETLGLPSNILTWDFAVFGATTDNELAGDGLIPAFTDQVQDFLDNLTPAPGTLSEDVPWTADNSLFAIWIGTNDVHAFDQVGNDIDAHFDKVVDSYFTSLGKLYDAGARRFLLISVPPLNRAPVITKSTTQFNAARTYVSTYNTKLTSTDANSRLTAFRSAHPNTNLTIVSAPEIWNPILNHPTDYGAPNANCSNKDGTSCLWWDDIHAASAIHNATAWMARGELVGLGFLNESDLGAGGAGSSGSASGAPAPSATQDSGTGAATSVGVDLVKVLVPFVVGVYLLAG